MKLLNFGMKYRRSRNPILRFLAFVCLTIVKRQTQKMEEEAEKAEIDFSDCGPSAEEMLQMAIRASEGKKTEQ
ncbi:MAG: hypothetical protein SOZ59_00515 [Candidatus Limivivens sp.]|nr:hypothetical protein [Candidatus Limivivens sp.]